MLEGSRRLNLIAKMDHATSLGARQLSRPAPWHASLHRHPAQFTRAGFGHKMTEFRLLTQTRQMTEYSCGASALQAVLKYWGKDIDEEALMKLMGTNDEVGTYPADMIRGAQALGFDTELRENTTLDDLEKFTAKGNPVIVLAQVWRSQKDTPESASDEWDCGH